ncbi:3-oxoacyl-ACP reductase [Novosphingobium marinum]|uniref:NAD(P)-dependent dehydrogenase (Short-subunit alcohol dehydrogenase family) n=1 Tax=Novosphingobium marinum TaxID=1514948 RepID=A0A7Y9XSG2_9SPHN|nr:SDR family oxidoreductase [Novosphingobium marinum]NYH93715.1 NAD(P)-dependent dehydrogenase (short-subunit alcohol dehydrogenase family) [Novosphingobium marinum]GGC16768.1 3-oxoacyl-ACP reductase [Novosphingobium marinum]
MDLELKGKKVVVSAATRGVGRRIVEGFLKEGAIVSFCGRRARSGEANPSDKSVFANPLQGDGVEDAVEALKDRGTVYGSVVDCGYFDQVTAWVEKAASDMGGIDIVVSNASALGGIPRNRKGWDINYNVDLMSAVAMFDTALPYMKKAGGGAFVQMSTITAIENHAFGESGLSYGAIKAALINYTHQLSIDYMKDGIRSNCVCPGPAYIEDGSWGFLEKEMPDYFRENRDRHPAGRFGKPEEIADAVLFLASARASWINGVNLTVDGGFTRNVKY